MTRRRHVVALITALLAVTMSACGISSEGSARRVTRDEIPFGLAQTDRATTTSSPAGGSATTIYLVRKGRLMVVERPAETGTTLSEVVDLLFSGPNRAERRLSITTALPEGRAVQRVSVSRGIATVDLDSGFGDIAADDQVLAIAQIVFTVTDRPGIGAVRFTLDAKSIDVPRGDGALTVNALSRDDFPKLAPRQAS